MYSYVYFNTDIINITKCNRPRRTWRNDRLASESRTQTSILIHECRCPSSWISALCLYIPLSLSWTNWIFPSFVDTRQIAFGTNLGADVLASVQLYSVSITNGFSARVSTRSSQFSPFSPSFFPFLLTCPRNYNLPLLFSIAVPLGPPALSSSCSSRVLTVDSVRSTFA